MTQRRRQAAPIAGQAPGGQDVDAWKPGRTMQPRPQQGTSLLIALQIVATDEGLFLARLAMKDPSTGKIEVAHDTKVMWHGGVDDVQAFGSSVGGAVMDAVEWCVS
jgi:hypothetical protein